MMHDKQPMIFTLLISSLLKVSIACFNQARSLFTASSKCGQEDDCELIEEKGTATFPYLKATAGTTV